MMEQKINNMDKTFSIYLVERKDNCSWDEYDSAVVIAENEKWAKFVNPRGFDSVEMDENKSITEILKEFPDYWTPDNLTVTFIGNTIFPEDSKGKLVLASFNAG